MEQIVKKTVIVLLLITGFGGPGLYAQNQSIAVSAATKTVASHSTPASLTPQPSPQNTVNDSGPMPFSNEEANFYRRAWPIDKSHSLGALILFGCVVVTLLSLIIRKMAQSGPRKPPQQ